MLGKTSLSEDLEASLTFFSPIIPSGLKIITKVIIRPIIRNLRLGSDKNPGKKSVQVQIAQTINWPKTHGQQAMGSESQKTEKVPGRAVAARCTVRRPHGTFHDVTQTYQRKY